MSKKMKLKLVKDERINKLNTKAKEIVTRINKLNSFPISGICKRIGCFRMSAAEIENLNGDFSPRLPIKVVSWKYNPSNEVYTFYCVSADFSEIFDSDIPEYNDVIGTAKC